MNGEAYKHFVADPRLLGYGNEHGVSHLRENPEETLGDSPVHDASTCDTLTCNVSVCDNPENTELGVIKTGNSAFFGWQSPEWRGIHRYLYILQKYGINLRESVKLHHHPVIERANDVSSLDLLKNLWENLSVGFVLKLLTKQWGRKCNYAITENFSEEPALKLSDLKDENVRKQVRDLLEKCETILEKEGLFVDPLGGAAISAALKYIIDPRNEPILSNLAMESGQLVLTDFGLMNVRDPERVYEIPNSEWAIRFVLSFLGHLAFEAVNMTLRDFEKEDEEEKLEARTLTVESALPKAAAWTGCKIVSVSRGFYESVDWSLVSAIGTTCSRIA